MKHVFVMVALTTFLLPKVMVASVDVNLLLNAPFLMSSQTNQLSQVGFNAFGGNEAMVLDTVSNLLASESASIEGKAYAYPSPALNGSTSIGFRVKDGAMDVLFELYDELGQKIYSLNDVFPAGYNRIPINSEIMGYDLPVGSYYFLLLKGSDIVTKGKFGVSKGDA
mgnify:CR=1 FL=1|tara:strand:+ start:1364 stop:1864 length:501 start_codon:yes stop_codon:yes gene_type:complete